MPSVTAGRLCPSGIFVPPRIDHYRQESHRIMDIVGRTGGSIEQVSIDEAYLELPPSALSSSEMNRSNRDSTVGRRAEDSAALPSGAGRAGCPQPAEPAAIEDELLYAAVPLAKELKNQITSERGLTASIGIASNKFLAKLASDFQKPNGLTLIPERDKVAFLQPLPVRAIPGVGRVTEETLVRAGVRTIGDLQNHAGDLRELVGSFGPTLKRLAFGQDDRPVDIGDEVKSISSEETFDQDTDNRHVLRAFLRNAAEDIAARLVSRHLSAHTVQVKVRYGDFTTLTRQVSVEDPTSEAREIYRLGCYLLAREKLVSRPLRLLGLGVSGLAESAGQQLTMPLGVATNNIGWASPNG